MPKAPEGIRFRLLAICMQSLPRSGKQAKSSEKIFQGNTKAKVSLDSESHCTKDSMNLSLQNERRFWVKLDLNTCAKWTTQEVALPEQNGLPSCVCNSQPRSKLMTPVQGHRGPFPVTVNIKDSRRENYSKPSPVAITCRTLPIVKCREGFNK